MWERKLFPEGNTKDLFLIFTLSKIIVWLPWSAFYICNNFCSIRAEVGFLQGMPKYAEMLTLAWCGANSMHCLLLLDNNRYPGVSSGFWLSSLGFQLCRWAIVNAEAEERRDPLCSKGGTTTSPGRKCSDALDDNGQTDLFCLFSHKVLMNKWGRGIKKLMLWEEIWVYQLLLGRLHFT